MKMILQYSLLLTSITFFGCTAASVSGPATASSSTPSSSLSSSEKASSIETSSSSSTKPSSSPCTGDLNGTTFVDCRDNQAYTYVTLGTQTWMSQNLNYGTLISSGSAQNSNGIVEKYCYNDLESNCKIYGALYQWNEAAAWPASSSSVSGSSSAGSSAGSSSSAALTGVCPTGWHIPTTAEVNTLISYVGSSIAGTALKSTHYWNLSSGTDADHFGFLPAGDRKYYIAGGFEKLGSVGYIWTATSTAATTAYDIEIDDNNSTVMQVNSDRAYGLSVRCIKD